MVASAAASAALSWGRRESNSEYFSSFDLLQPDHYLLHTSPPSTIRNSGRSGAAEDWDQTRPTPGDMPTRRATRRLATESGLTADVLSDHSLATPTCITPPPTDSIVDFGQDAASGAAAFSYEDISAGSLPSAPSAQAVSCDVPGVQWIPNYQYWRARWTDTRTNEPTSRYFSAKRYGFERAQKLAVSARLKAESRGLARVKANAESEGEEDDEFFKQMEAELSPEQSPSLPPCSFHPENCPAPNEPIGVKPETPILKQPRAPVYQQQQRPIPPPQPPKSTPTHQVDIVRKKKRMPFPAAPSAPPPSISLMRQQQQHASGGGPIRGGHNSLGVLVPSMKNPNSSAAVGARGPEWKKDYRCWQVALTDSSGCKWLYFFSAKKHGIEKAREMAFACQRTGVPKGAVQLSTIQKLHATRKMKSEMCNLASESFHNTSSSAPVPQAPPRSIHQSSSAAMNFPPSPRAISAASNPAASHLMGYSGSSPAADYYASMASAVGGLGGGMSGFMRTDDMGAFSSYMTGLQGQGGPPDGGIE
eukprot:GHVS01088774.1.p1 GENE.GHVS01088774.1~~GHVS01088774.1.p1  ORF type:complete len:607 (-),score=123.74 GHVS01088774.1:882-2480(-)